MKQPTSQDKPARRKESGTQHGGLKARAARDGDSPKARDSATASVPASRSGRRHASRQRYEGTEGNNALQSRPDDSREVSMLDSGKHSERSPYVAGQQ